MKKKRRQFGATLTIVIVIFAVMLASYILSLIGFSGSKTEITHSFLESSIISINNILSVDGFRFIIGSFVSNLNFFAPLAIFLVALISASIVESSGIIKKLVAPYRKINNFILTTIVVFVSMVSVFFGEYTFLLLMPIFALIYKELGRNPLLGLLTVFLAITVGFSTGVFVNYYDFILSETTQKVANITLDPTYGFNLYAYMYVKVISLFALTFLLSYLIEKFLTKNIPKPAEEVEEIEFLKNESKALKLSLSFFIIYVGSIIYALIPNTWGSQVLLDMSEDLYVAKLFSETSPFNEGAFLFILLGFAITSYIYGTLTSKYKEVKDFSSGFSKHFQGMGETFVLIFFISQLIAILDWTNIGKVISVKLIEIMSVLEFTGAPLIILLFVFTFIIGLLITSTVEKWELMSPIAVPLFMKANFTPEFAQIIFRAADGVSKAFTPLFPYYIILLGFIKKYNNERPITLFGAVRLMAPILLIMIGAWLVILLMFYIIGMPIGPEVFPTL